MAVYRLIAPLADPNTLSCVNTQVYQGRGMAVAKFALHIVPLSTCLCPYHAKKGYPDPARGKDTPYVVVKGKCQGLMFSDFVSPTPFKRLERLFPRLRQAFALWGLGGHPGYALKWGRRYPISWQPACE